MDKKTFTVVAAIEIPIAFIILSILLSNRSDETFYIAWAIFAVVVSSLLIFLKKRKTKPKKLKSAGIFPEYYWLSLLSAPL